MDGFGRPFFFVRRLALPPGVPKYADAPGSLQVLPRTQAPPKPPSTPKYVDTPELPNAPKYADTPELPGASRNAAAGRPRLPDPQALSSTQALPSLQRHPSTNSSRSPNAPKHEDAPSLQGHPSAQTSPDPPITLTFSLPRCAVVFMRNSAFSAWMSSGPQACGCHRALNSCKGRTFLPKL